MRRRALVLILSVLIAAVGTGLVAVYVKNADDRALAGQKVITVYFAQKAIPSGTSAGKLEGLIGSKAVRADAVSPDVIYASTQLDSLTALGAAQFDIPQGLPLSRSFFAATGAGNAKDLPESNVEMLISLPGPASAAGLAAIGGEVTVLVTETPVSGLTKVLIPSAHIVSINGYTADSATAGAVDGADSTVGLSVPLEQGKLLTWAQQHGYPLYLVTKPTPTPSRGGGVGLKDMP